MGCRLNSFSPVDRKSVRAETIKVGWGGRLGPAQIREKRPLHSSFSKLRRLPWLHVHRKIPWRSKGGERHLIVSGANLPAASPLCWNPSKLKDEHAHMGRLWDKSNTDSEPGKQDDWFKKTQKNCPMKVIQTTVPVGLSLSLSVCLATGT